MKLKDIFLTSAFFLASNLAFSQNPRHFEIYTKGENFPSIRLNTGSVNVTPKEVDFSFLFNLYSINLKKLNDSTYQEIVKDNYIITSKEEFFTYILKDSKYTLKDYSVVGGEPRKEKEALKGVTLDKKYKTLIEVFNDFENGNLKDSVHIFIFGLPYSVGINKIEEKDKIIYFGNLGGAIKQEPGDFIIFPYPAEVIGKKENGKFIPSKFFTKSLNVRNKRVNTIEGILKED